MATYKLYIGSNNKTHVVEVEKVENTLNEQFDGYTIETAVGYWKGQRENSIVVTISGSQEGILSVIERLKVELEQEAIAYQEVNELKFA